ncbi:MAG: SGNH/GDSL hydrolase family protein [Bacteroidia bacterium]
MVQAWVFSMRSKRLLRYVAAVSLLFSSCKPSLDEPRYTSGTADFSSFVAVGTGYTAGISNGALTRTGQLESFPALLASKFALAEGGSFRQPLVNPGNGFGFNPLTQQYSGVYKLVNQINCLGKSDVMVKQLSVNTADFSYIGLDGPYNNMGVPGAKSYNLYSQTFGKGGSNGNPYYHRFATDTGSVGGLSSTVIGDALLNEPTFFTLWIGNSDVLNFATIGGLNIGNPDYEITPVPTFEAALDTIVESLTSNGAEGVIANIPDVTELPFFSTIPYNGLALTQAQADSLNLVAPVGITYQAGANPFVVYSGATGGAIRQLGAGELVLSSVSIDDIRCNKLGTSLNPIPSGYILDSTEVAQIKNAITGYNTKLRNTANLYNLAFADMNAYFKQLKAGVVFNGAEYSISYLSGGAFSLDGVHPNGRGYALIANEFIRVINARYNSNLPLCDVNASTGVLFP